VFKAVSAYSEYFSVSDLLEKINTLSGGGYCHLIRSVLTLYVLLINEEGVTASRFLIVAALGYFICPIDAIPDFTPVVGYSDDLGIMLALLSQLEDLISQPVKAEVDSLMPDSCC